MLSRHGFTLVELMIVVAVIGILAAMAIPQYANLQDHAREASTKDNAHTLQLTVEDYAIRHDGVYSVAGADLTPLLPGQGLMGNVFTGAPSEPRFGAAATGPGQIGLQGHIAGGIMVGYTITAEGKNQQILSISSGQ